MFGAFGFPGLWGCGKMLVWVLASGGWSVLRALLLGWRYLVACGGGSLCGCGLWGGVWWGCVAGCCAFGVWRWWSPSVVCVVVGVCRAWLLVVCVLAWGGCRLLLASSAFGGCGGAFPIFLGCMSLRAPCAVVWFVSPVCGLPVVLQGWFGVVLHPSRLGIQWQCLSVWCSKTLIVFFQSVQGLILL